MLAGTVLAYLFAAISGGEKGDYWAPFSALGQSYPADALYMAGSFWCLLIGLMCILAPSKKAVTGSDPAARMQAAQAAKGGRISKLMFLNAFLLLSSLFVTYVGARVDHPEVAIIYTFACVAAAQAALGLILLILSLLERPKGAFSLAVGTVVYLAGVGLTVLAFLMGGGD
jgi:hypothetical protein